MELNCSGRRLVDFPSRDVHDELRRRALLRSTISGVKIVAEFRVGLSRWLIATIQPFESPAIEALVYSVTSATVAR